VKLAVPAILRVFKSFEEIERVIEGLAARAATINPSIETKPQTAEQKSSEATMAE